MMMMTTESSYVSRSEIAVFDVKDAGSDQDSRKIGIPCDRVVAFALRIAATHPSAARPVRSSACIDDGIDPKLLTPRRLLSTGGGGGVDGPRGRAQSRRVVVDVDALPALALGQGEDLVHDADVFQLADVVVPPVPRVAVDRRQGEVVDVFDGAPVRDGRVLVAHASLAGRDPRCHAHDVWQRGSDGFPALSREMREER